MTDKRCSKDIECSYGILNYPDTSKCPHIFQTTFSSWLIPSSLRGKGLITIPELSWRTQASTSSWDINLRHHSFSFLLWEHSPQGTTSIEKLKVYCWRKSFQQLVYIGSISIPSNKQPHRHLAALIHGLKCCWNCELSRIVWLCVPGVVMGWQLLQPCSGHFLPAKVQMPAEVWHLALLCKGWKDISRLALN